MMNKDIKFRVWSYDRKMFIIDGMTIKQLQDDASESLELPMLTNENCAWSQFIGIQDANGKDIYEGDFVTFNPSIEFMGNCIHKNICHFWIPSLIDGVQVSYNHPFSEMSDPFNGIISKYYSDWLDDKPRLELIVVGNYFENTNMMEDYE